MPLDLVGVLALDRVGLERGQLLQAQLEDRLRLDVREPEALHQARARHVAVARAADQLDHLVEVVERDQQALEAVDLRLERAQLVLGAADDDLALVLDVVVDDRRSGSVRGTLSTSATMFTPNVVCIGVCL